MPAAPRTAWLVVLLLMPVALLNYLDRQMLASMKASVMADVPDIATQENWGVMLGQFKWVYAVLSPVGGYLADRVSRRVTICGSLFVWSAVTWATGQVTTYSELLWARSLMGVSEAFYIPAALALVADHHAGATRSRAVGLHQIAIYLGVIAGGFGGYAADDPAVGWRAAFAACGLLGMAYALPLAMLLKNAPPTGGAEVCDGTPSPRWGEGRDDRRSDRGEGICQLPNPSPRSDSVGPTLPPTGGGCLLHNPVPVHSQPRTATPPHRAMGELLSNRSFVLLVLYFTLPALAGWVVRDWMPAILKERYGIGQGKAGVAATVYWQAAAILGAALGGWLADRWMRRSERGRIFVSAIGMAMIVPAILGVGHAGTLAAAVAFLILFGLGWGFFDGNNMPILAQLVRPGLRATGYGVMNLVSTGCGGLADWGFGALRDRAVPLGAIFGLFAAAAGVSVGLVLMIRVKPLSPSPALEESRPGEPGAV